MAHPPKIAHKVNKSKTNKFPIDLTYGTLPKKVNNKQIWVTKARLKMTGLIMKALSD